MGVCAGYNVACGARKAIETTGIPCSIRAVEGVISGFELAQPALPKFSLNARTSPCFARIVPLPVRS
eukprot:2735433-Prymnesium_polylepis.1